MSTLEKRIAETGLRMLQRYGASMQLQSLQPASYDTHTGSVPASYSTHEVLGCVGSGEMKYEAGVIVRSGKRKLSIVRQQGVPAPKPGDILVASTGRFRVERVASTYVSGEAILHTVHCAD